MSCTQLAVTPEIFEMGSLETLPLTFSAADLILPGETISEASAQLVQVDTGVDYIAGRLGEVAVAGTDLTQTVTGLVPRKRYRLSIQFTVAVDKVWAPYLTIECPQ
jgi:hypothetical protein